VIVSGNELIPRILHIVCKYNPAATPGGFAHLHHFGFNINCSVEMGQPESQVYISDAESARNASDDQLVRPERSWKGHVWDTFDLPKDERWLMFKLDAFVLTFASVSDSLQIWPDARCGSVLTNQ
jgi:hypothetical protein